MSKSRIPSHGRKTRGTTLKQSTLKTTLKSSSEANDIGKVHRFLGVSLAGGKTDKACVAVVEYYPKHKKIFLARVIDRIKSEDNISADLKIHEIFEFYREEFDLVAFDVPNQLPSCLRCKLKCPGYENCSEPHIEWMWEYTRKIQKVKRPKKLFTPYTQRCVELFLQSGLEEPFQLGHAMGSNTAPLLARAMFLKQRLDIETIEVNPRVSLWRIGSLLGVMKSHLRFHRHAVGGEESRKQILNALSDHNVAFVYEQDVKLMIANNHAFEAFLCALTGYLKYKGMTEEAPEGFPENEDWIHFPKKKVSWV